jgi:hypothetical protein
MNKELTLFKIESLSDSKGDVLCSEDGSTIYIYENGILYDTDEQFNKTTSHRMSKLNLTIKPLT